MIRLIKNYFKKLEYKKLEKVRQIARLISQYYIGKNGSKNIEDAYAKARKEISSLGITRIELTRKNIVITLCRPGILIGSRGTNLDALELFFKTRRENRGILIKEDNIIEWIMPYVSDDWGDY